MHQVENQKVLHLMSKLTVIEVDGVFVVDSRLIADRLDIDHKSFIKTVRKYQTKVEQRFGCIRFEISSIQMPKGGTREEVSHAYLTEDQANTIMTFSKNTEVVIDCKLDLVESFSKAREIIKQFAIPQTRAEALRLAAMNQIEDQKVLHSVENLTHLYRARRYNTGNLGLWLPYKYHVLGGTTPNTWLTLYELCPVVKTTAMEIIVVSQNIPLDILELFPDFYKGGKFHINKAKLQQSGRAYHSRHGEYFYIAVPDSAIALSESKELVEV